MSEFPKTGAEAPAQAAGYLFQLRFALFRALKKLLRDPTGSIAIECADDVALASKLSGSSGPALVELDQLKHSTNASTVFNDQTLAIWRTIGNWARLLAADTDINLAILDLILVTNASVEPHTGIALLGLADDDRDVTTALEKLTTAAKSSQNQASQKDRHVFLAMGDAERGALVRAIRIVPNSPSLAALGSEIEDLLHYACESAQLQEFRVDIEGWWFDRIANAFSTGTGAIVPLLELEARVSYLREKYKIGTLQIDIEDPTEHPDSLDAYLFVQQVVAVKAGEQRLRNAQRDFLKASAQRSKWLRDARIDPAELDKYDQSLQANWLTKSAILLDELPASANDTEKCTCGRQILGWAETQQAPLRGAAAQFLTSGSYHALADDLRVGWHPDFRTMFKAGS